MTGHVYVDKLITNSPLSGEGKSCGIIYEVPVGVRGDET